MKIEQALITQLMILLNIKNGKNRPSEISKELDITLQGVVYHLKILRGKRYIDDNNKITKSGFDFLYNGLNNIENFVHYSLINIDASLIWESISDDDTNGGDRLYLYMQDGYLHSTKSVKKVASGRSIKTTKKNQCAGVTDVNGIIQVNSAKITVLLLENIEKIDKIYEYGNNVNEKINNINYDFIGIVGELARIITKNIKIDVKFEYAAIESSFEAAKRGFSSLVLISDRLFHFALNNIKELQTKNPEIEINFIHV